ncbi:hypothetical protein PAXRUDRAFT_708544 [Paxillus rubicundulus Ve08.2h10]|uniref:Unplaced genomic scaffold scaffold_788, whole genome shotgun sequence n=1 Tax=Paxillus rubicundulus Ve08.2h10 TaxID=930991 RepID=A0A0D0D3M8_9AGAM|nr:hypothetical protein PAXRUDRAFT_708544 [Paxillus rubicundulus Ve08.2h10]
MCSRSLKISTARPCGFLRWFLEGFTLEVRGWALVLDGQYKARRNPWNIVSVQVSSVASPLSYRDHKPQQAEWMSAS